MTGGSTTTGSTFQTDTDEYDGTNWTAVTVVPVGTQSWGGCGTQVAGLVVGGSISGSKTDVTHEYDGTNWSTGGSLVGGARYSAGIAGTQTSCIAMGGATPFKNTCEVYDGTSWKTTANLTTARSLLQSAGASGASALGAGGYTAGVTHAATEEFTAESSAAEAVDIDFD